MSHRAVILQSNYIPWKGYFDLLAHADTVVFLDSVQSTKNDWRNRNLICTPSGKTWLTVPTRHSNALRIREVEIANPRWHEKHFRTLSQSYARAPHAMRLLPTISTWYEEAGTCNRLSDCNRVFIREVAKLLGIQSRFIEVEHVLSDEEHDRLGSTARLVEICKRIGATSYLTGPAASTYLDVSMFESASIGVAWFDYDAYPIYPQLHGDFDHAVSILDLLLMTGSSARDFAVRPHPKFLQESMT